MRRVNAKEALSLIRAGAVVVDVREEFEFARAWIKGAVNVPLAQFSEAVAQDLLTRSMNNQPLVVMCLGGVRSARACERLPEGFHVVIMEDGLQGWRRERLPVEETAGRWLRGLLGA